jgi:6-phosphogluconolactonase (cycloisomerase 2 family)
MKHQRVLTSGLVISAIVNIGFLAGCGGGTSQTLQQPPPLNGSNPTPTIATISPSSAVAGTAAGFTLTVNGTNFVSAAAVNFGGTSYAANFVSSTQLTAAIPAAAIASAGTAAVTVTNPAPGGGTSNTVNFTIIAGSTNPIPTITAISPPSAVAGSAAGFTLMVNGTNFVFASVVNFGGTLRTTTFVSSTQLTAAIPAAAIASAGMAAVTVTNPAPGGGTSNTVNFTTVGNPVPSITSISPNSAATGGSAFTLTVNGTNFVSTSLVSFGGTARTTMFVSSTQLTASIDAAAIATDSTAQVWVTNPAPGGGSSNTMNFMIGSGGGNPVPTISGLSPNVATAGGPAFTLTVNDFTNASFGNGSIVRWNGSDRPTSFVAINEITAQIPASDVAATGTATITVFNPAPGGGISNAATFTITTGGVGPGSVAVAPDPSGKFGKFVYVANINTNNISMYTIDAKTGALASKGTIPAGISPASVTVDPSARFAYVTNFGSNDVSTHIIDATTGALTPNGAIAAGSNPRSIAIDSSGKFAYVTNYTSNDVSMYTIDATTGALTSNGTIVAGTRPVSVAVDPSGKFVYVANAADCDFVAGSVSMYKINTAFNGALSSTGTIAAGFCASSVAVDPSGKFAYVANAGDGNVSMYAIDATTGALTSNGTIVAGTRPVSVAVDPSGKFAYVTNSSSNGVSMYSLNAASGALTSLGTIGTGMSPTSIAIDPSSKFAYVTNFASNDVSIYSINATGSLTLIGIIGT